MPIIGGTAHWVGPVIGAVLLGTVQQVAGAAGIAVMITVMSAVGAGALETGASATAAEAQGAHAAFLLSAIISLPLLVGAFLVRKPVDAPDSAPAHRQH